MPPIKILHIISRLPLGGVENLLLNTVKNYDKKRFMPCVCSLSDKGVVGAEIERLGIDVISLNKLSHSFDWSIVGDIQGIIRERDVRVVRSDQYHANLYGRLAAWKAGVPCIVAAVHNVYTRDKKLHRRAVNRLFSRFTDSVVAVSEAVKRDVIKYDRVPEHKVKVIYNGIELDAFSFKDRVRARALLGIGADAPVVGNVGRLVEQKGQRYLIEAVSMLRRDFPDIVLLMVGDGPEKEGLKAQARSLGIEKNVMFALARTDVPDMLSAMDVFAFPSLWEGLGNALIEAMASGLPVVASDIMPIREIMGPVDCGAVVRPKDARSIASSIGGLLRDRPRAQRLGSAGRQRVEAQFSIKRNVTEYERLFQEILNSKDASYAGGLGD